MQKDSKIFVAGHRGLVGSALVRNLQKKGFTNLILKTSSELDLSDQKATAEFFAQEKPEYVLLAAAKVGGMIANNTYRGFFIYENIQIQTNVIHQSYKNGVKKLLFLGSSCIYPKECPQPIKEESLLTDTLEYTNEPYAIAKIAGIKMCESYNIQYGTNFIPVMPTSLYGANDNYDLEKSHVLPALTRKMHLGKCLMNNDWDAIRSDLNKLPIEGINGKDDEKSILTILGKYGITADGKKASVTLWGTGAPLREFLNSDDMADACVFIMENIDFKDLVDIRKKEVDEKEAKNVRNTFLNIGSGKDETIKDLALMIKDIVGFEGELIWDTTKPDGTYRKLLNVDKLQALGWKPNIPLKDGLNSNYKNYVQQ
jgi:GDP-L-fucose synthase